MSAKDEIDVLANFIMAEVTGEPSLSEGAGTTAIRIIRDLQSKAEYTIGVLRNMGKDDIVDYIEETWPD